MRRILHRSAKLRYIAVGMSMAGSSASDIGRRLEVPRTTVVGWLAKFQRTGDVERLIGSGRPRSTTERSNRRLVRICRSNRFSSSASLLKSWGEEVTARTLRNRLHEAQMFSRKPAVHPLLSPSHKARRLAWSMARCHFRRAQWNRIAFTDESRFVLRPVDGRVRVWREKNQRLREDCSLSSTAFGGGSVHVWGGICTGSRSELVILRQSVTAKTYSELLEKDLLPWATESLGDSSSDWKLQDDNAPAHRARFTEESKARLNIRTIPWPARSPDLNPIEHVWNILGMRLQQRSNPPTSLAALANALREEWTAIPQAMIDNLIDSMPRRVQAVIEAKGGPTRY